jgi:hypothetical protein
MKYLIPSESLLNAAGLKFYIEVDFESPQLRDK